MFSFKEFTESLVHLTQLRKTRLLKLLNKNESDNFSAGDCLVFWLDNLLRVSAPLSEPQIDAIIEEYYSDVCSFGNDLYKNLENKSEKIPVASLFIIDRNYVTLSGKQWFFDILSGKRKEKLNAVPLECISYNMTSLYTVSLTQNKKNKNANRNK